MSIKLINIILFYYLSVISILGYGFFFRKILTDKNIKLDYGYCGLIGIFFLTIYSYLSHFFIKHGLSHNLIIFLIGILLFFFFIKNKLQKKGFNTFVFCFFYTSYFLFWF